MPVPVFSISVGGVDITGKISGGGITLRVTDGEGIEADTVEIVIDDQNGVIDPPRSGVDIDVSGGYADEIVHFGTYTVDQVVYAGFPQTITISAQAVKAKGNPKKRSSKGYTDEEYPTYGDIFSEVSGRMGLSLTMSSSLKGKANPYEAQGEEEDISFVTRLAKKLNAIVTVKSGRLIVTKRGETVSGAALAPILVSKGRNLLDYSVTRKDKPKHQKVKATWFDRKKAKLKEVEASTGSEGPEYRVRAPLQSEGEARDVAAAKADELKRAEATASFTIDGEPGAQAEAKVIAAKIRRDVDGTWIAKTVTHEFSSSGPYTTTLECELPK